MTRDMAFALGMLLLTAVLYRETLSFPPGSPFRAAPAAFPQFLLAIMGGLSFLLLLRALVVDRAGLRVDVRAVGRNLRDYWMVSAMFALFGLYILGMRQFGFVPATLAYLLVTQLLIARKFDLRTLAITVAVTVVATLSVYYLFTQVLRIWLP